MPGGAVVGVSRERVGEGEDQVAEADGPGACAGADRERQPDQAGWGRTQPIASPRGRAPLPER